MKNKFLVILSMVILLTGVFAVKANADEKAKTQINSKNAKFHIKGILSSVSANSFVVNGLTILIDPSQVKKFQQQGMMQNGDFAQVQGVIINDIKYAKQIEIKNHQDNQDQDNDTEIDEEIDDDDYDDQASSPTPSVSPSIIPSATPFSTSVPSVTPSLIPSISPEASNQPVIDNSVKLGDLINQLIEMLKKVFKQENK